MNTVSKQSGGLSRWRKREILVQVLEEEANESKSLFPLSHGQQALWFLYKLAPKSWANNSLFTVRIRSDLDTRALRRAFQVLISRHSSLRTTYTERDGKPFQQIHENSRAYFEEIDASAWDWEELKEQVSQASHRPFNLEQGSVMRVSLFTRSPKDHILLLAIHHIAIDFWSLSVLIDELRILYPAEKVGTLVSLSPQALSYADYVRWQRKMLTGSIGEHLWAYWRKQLAGELSVLNLPTDRPRPLVQTYCGASCNFKLSEQITQRLKELMQAERSTLFMLLLASFQVLLHRYTGQEDILVGSPMSGRMQREFAGVVGYFVNPVVLRANLSGNPSFKAFLSQVRQTVLAAIVHQDYPFPLLIERLQPNRDPSRSPLFQVLFALQKPQRSEQVIEVLTANNAHSRLDWGGLELEPFSIPQLEGQFDLTLEMIEVREALFGVFKYNTDLFDEATIVRMVENFQTLLESLVINPEQRLSDLPLLGAIEQRLLESWNDTQTISSLDERRICIHQLFEAQVEQTPDAVAVVFGNQQLTYRELNTRANQLAHYLQTLGVEPEVLVGICVERSLEMVVGILGVLKSGGAYVPLDSAYPKERLAYMLLDSQVPVLLTQQKLVALLPEHQAHVVCLDTDWEVISEESDKNPINSVEPENLSYVIYTSGSTGKPKGVLVTHQGLGNLAEVQIQTFDIHPDSRVLQFASLSFDASIGEIFTALCSGARLYLATSDSLLPGLALMHLMHKQAITHVLLPPSALSVLSPNESPSGLTIIVAGESCSADLMVQWSKRRRFFNAYGPTESTVCATIAECTNISRKPHIGRPIANIQVYILDRHLQPVPIGVPGELHIGGAGLARGYLNRPDLTEEKFIPNPFSTERGARLYKTGDLCRYLADGNIEFLGRLDHQVKIRGFRIELGEIEAVLRQHPQVRETVVIAREEPPGNKRLVAYVVPNITGEDKSTGAQEQVHIDNLVDNFDEHSPHLLISPSQLRRFLKQYLPEYMVPSAFIILDALPLMPNGKVDRRALPVPDTSRRELEEGFVPPRDPLELQLTQIWSAVLDVHPVGVQDNFFDKGGHSLLAVCLMAQMQQQFGQNLPLSTLLQNPTIEQLATILRNHSDAPAWSPLIAIQPGGDQPPFLCIHPVGGSVFCYADLATHLGREQPFYGLQSPGLDGEQEPLNQIEDMAAYYVAAMQTIQPQGPYHIGGWSLGGVVAFEMAQQLHSCGHKVALLALIDSYAPIAIYKPEQMSQAMLLSSFAKDLGGLLGQELSVSVEQLQPLELDAQLNHILEQANMVNLLLPEVGLQQLRQLFRVFQSNLEAMYRYRLQPYSGRMTLLCASEQVVAVTPDPNHGWGELAFGGLETHTIPGNHYTIVRSQVLAELLKNLLPIGEIYERNQCLHCLE